MSFFKRIYNKITGGSSDSNSNADNNNQNAPVQEPENDPEYRRKKFLEHLERQQANSLSDQKEDIPKIVIPVDSTKIIDAPESNTILHKELENGNNVKEKEDDFSNKNKIDNTNYQAQPTNIIEKDIYPKEAQHTEPKITVQPSPQIILNIEEVKSTDNTKIDQPVAQNKIQEKSSQSKLSYVVEITLLVTPDVEKARSNNNLLYLKELKGLLESTEKKEISIADVVDECLMKILQIQNGIDFEDSKSKFNYLMNAYERSLNFTIEKQLNEVGIQKTELSQIFHNHSINLILSPEIYEITEKKEILTDYFCNICFADNNEFSKMYVGSLLTLMDAQNQGDNIKEIIQILCYYVIKKRAFLLTFNEVRNVLKFLYDACSNLPLFFQEFVKSPFSIYHPFLEKLPQNPDVFQQHHFFSVLFYLSYFPEENMKAVQLFERESWRTLDTAVHLKSKDFYDFLYMPMIEFIKLYLKGDENTQNQLVMFLKKLISLNQNRRKEYVQISSKNSVFHNFLFVFLKIIENELKFENQFSEILTIDPNYLYTSSDLSSLIEYNDNSAVKKVFASVSENKSTNILTKLYILTTYLHYLYKNIHTKYYELINNIQKEMHKSKSIMAPQARTLLNYKCCYDVALLDPKFLQARLNILHFDILFILHLLKIKTPSNKIEMEDCFINLKKTGVEGLELLPLFLLQNMNEVIKLIKDFNIKFFSDGGGRLTDHYQYLIKTVSNLWLLCLGSSKWSTNPHFRAEIMKTLSSCIPNNKIENRKHYTQKELLKKMSIVLQENPLYKEFFVESMLCFFIDIEKTGSHNQFFEKFSYRYFFYLTMNYFLNSNQEYPKKFSEFCELNAGMSLKFMNLMLNDLIYLLDESIDKIKSIKSFEDAQSNPPAQNQNQALADHRMNISRAKSILHFLYVNYETLQIFTKNFPQLLLKQELIDKFAANINYSLVKFHGPNFHELKLKNPKQISFRPSVIAKILGKSLIHMKEFPMFYDALIKDGRSFSLEIYHETGRIYSKNNIMSEIEIQQYEEFYQKLEEKIKENKNLEEKLGTEHIPEEFLDPLMSEIMKDPVKLPGSGVIIDRITIIKHLLSDPTDPFNRQPLKEEDLIPQNELKNKINEFLQNIKEKLK